MRRALLAAGFLRRGATMEYGEGAYTETWEHSKDNTKIELTWDKKTPEILGSVRYRGDAIDEQVRWGNCADPRGVLAPMTTLYDVTKIEVHSCHTKIWLHGLPAPFNSVHFDWLDEAPLRNALSNWRRAHS